MVLYYLKWQFTPYSHFFSTFSMNFPCEALIFDLDGTLLDTIPAILKTCNLTLQKYSLPEINAELTRKFVGDGVAKLVERFLIHTGGTDAYHSLFQDACHTYADFFAQFCMDGVTPYPGMADTLHALKKAGLRLGVLTNKDQARAEDNIHGFFGKGLFDAIYGIKDGRKPKPDITALMDMVRQFGTTPDKCLYIGDTNTDMQTAQNASIPKVGALWGFRGREELALFHPEFLLEQPSDILSILGLARTREQALPVQEVC